MPQLMLPRTSAPVRTGIDEAAARRSLRGQIAKLEGELSELFGRAYPRGGFAWQVGTPGGPRLLELAELEVLRDRLAAKIADAREQLREHNEAERANARLIDRMIADPRSYKFVQVSAEDVGARGCRHWHSLPRLGVIGMMLGWWRVRISSGCPLASGRGHGLDPEQPDGKASYR